MSTPTPDDSTSGAPQSGKGKATPSRKERVEANRRPLVPNDRKAERERLKAERAKVREGMLRGDDRYLPPRDAGPQRAFVRDWIDSRVFIIGEYALPIMLGLLLIPFFTGDNLEARFLSVAITYGYLLIVILVSLFLIWRLGHALAAKFGKDKLQRGWRLYAFMRSLTFRSARVPKPRVARGEHVE